MKQLPIILTLTVALSACQSSPINETDVVNDFDDINTNIYQNSYAPEMHKVTLANYAEQIVLGLYKNGRIPQQGNIAVASFVDFDNTLKQTNMLGNQLAENVLMQLQRFGYPVTETKALSELEINSNGDFVLSRSNQWLSTPENFCCILAGTMIYGPRGIEVNSRLFDSQSNSLIASSQVTIPYFVTRHLGSPR